jgi:hypothetical protein
MLVANEYGMAEGALSTSVTSLDPNTAKPSVPIEEEHFCKLILYTEISNSR